MPISNGSSRSASISESARPPQIVYLDAESVPLPPRPPGYTRFVLLSDTHTHTFPVPEGDILLHAGDLTEYGTIEELEITLDWLAGMPHQHKVLIAGNHDDCLDEATLIAQQRAHDERKQRKHVTTKGSSKGKRGPAGSSVYTDIYAEAEELLSRPEYNGLIYLKDEACSISVQRGSGNGNHDAANGTGTGKTNTNSKTWKIWGLPWSAALCSLAFNIPAGVSSAHLYEEIPDDIDILMTHGPPYEYLDRIRYGHRSVGCKDLQKRTLEIQPRLHVWGHIHEDRGVQVGVHKHHEHVHAQKMPEEETRGKLPTVFVNAANAGTFSRPREWGTGGYQPIVVDLRDDEDGNGGDLRVL